MFSSLCSGRRLDDSELDSGDDEGRNDRTMDVDGSPGVQRELNVMEMNLARHTIPKGDDGEVSNFRAANIALLTCPQALHAQGSNLSRYRARSLPQPKVPTTYNRPSLEWSSIGTVLSLQCSS